MRSWRMFLALVLSVTVSRECAGDDVVRGLDDDPQSAAAIRELVRRGAVVKRFAVVESDTKGLLVRLKAEHLSRAGAIAPDILAALVPLRELALELRHLPLCDEGLKLLLTKVTLIGLDVSGSEITDRGLHWLASTRSQLRLLDLSFTRVSDAGLKEVVSQSELRHISLIGCRVSNSGLASLSCLRKLREVYLTKTDVTPQGAEQLKRTLPTCRIER